MKREEEKHHTYVAETPYLHISKRKYVGDMETEIIDLESRSYDPKTCLELMNELITMLGRIK